MVEPWLRGTHTDIPPVQRAVLHALELAREDMQTWCGRLSPDEMEAAPFGLPSAGFQARHIARSLDRLMTYAEGAPLNGGQLQALQQEMKSDGDPMAELLTAIDHAISRLLAITMDQLEEPRGVGRQQLPTTVTSLLIHLAEHTQRHVGQAITTTKVVLALRGSEAS